MRTSTPQSAIILELFYDGDCPLCNREIQLLRWMDRKRRISFVDIAGPDFRPEDYGKSMSELMDVIHARRPDGSWITEVEVFRQLYSAVGLSGLAWISRLPILSQLADWGYQLFARNRLRLTGRCSSDGSCRSETGSGTSA